MGGLLDYSNEVIGVNGDFYVEREDTKLVLVRRVFRIRNTDGMCRARRWTDEVKVDRKQD